MAKYKESKNGSLESNQKGYEIIKENEVLYAHIFLSYNLEIIGYSNSDFGRCQDSRKSTLGYIYFLVGGAVSWRSA